MGDQRASVSSLVGPDDVADESTRAKGKKKETPLKEARAIQVRPRLEENQQWPFYDDSFS